MEQSHDYCGRCCYKKYKAEIAKVEYEKRQGKLFDLTA